jgi:hypothetical protein
VSKQVTEIVVPAGLPEPPPGGYLAAMVAALAGELRQPADVALWESEWELEALTGDG